MLIFQYYSDLHLEFRTSVPKIFPNYKDGFTPLNNKYICVLAGDIGNPYHANYWTLIRQVNYCFDYVFIICGNHEFYGHTIHDTLQHIEKTCKNLSLKNTHLLYNKEYCIDNCLIIGSTLWSNIPSHVEKEITERMNDYKCINDFTVSYQNQQHEYCLNYVKETLNCERYKNLKKVVITHHAPLFKTTSDPKFDTSISTYAFGTDCHECIDKCDYWIYGHTHYNSNHSNPKLKTNQLGYGENPIKGFNYAAEITI
jgi:hypothetical protein